MVIRAGLKGSKVLVTRPRQQADGLCNSINAAGGEAIALPTIEIVALEIVNVAAYQLEKQDIIIFVSRNAVQYFATEWRAMLAADVVCVAIGAGTAKLMQANGFQTVLQPSAPAGSESLLDMSVLHDVVGKNIVIVRGQDGRELLAETLTARGAQITYLEVYQRALPTRLPDRVKKQAISAQCIIIASVNSFVNLCRLIGAENVTNKHLIVVSERIKQYAIKQGVKHISVADDPSDNAVMRQLAKVDGN